LFQLQGSLRGIDSGENANPGDTGYERLFVSPGLQVVATSHLSLYADLKIPIVTHVRGNQLVAPALVNITMGFNF